jgi:hypothetical protein
MLGKFFFLFFAIITFSANAECNFISGNYINGLNDPSKIKEIKIEVNDKRKYAINYLKILTSDSYNISPKLKKNFRAKIIVKYPFGECIYKGKVRQNGDNKDHIGFKTKKSPVLFRSLVVKLDTGNILNAVKFKLLIPDTRNNLNEILGSILLREADFIVPETFHVIVSINERKNLMIFQEDVRKELLERNKRREGPIFEGDESIYWYPFFIADQSLSRVVNKNWALKGPSSMEITLNAFTKLQQAYLESRQNQGGYDTFLLRIDQKNKKLFEKYLISMIIMNGSHGLSINNRKFYYNSFADYFEPIYYDGDLSLNKKISIDDNLIIKSIKEISPLEYSPFFLNIKNETEIYKKFKKRTKTDNYTRKIFFEGSIKTLKTNEKYLLNLIRNIDKTKFEKRNLERDFNNYLDASKNNSLDEVVITKIDKFDKKYLVFTNNDRKFTLTNNELSKIISRNEYQKKRHTYIPIKHIENNEFKLTNINNSVLIKHSKNLKIKTNLRTRTIKLTQKFSDDWAIFINANLKDWTIKFEGISSKKKKSDKFSQRFNQFGLTGCLSFYKSSFMNTYINVDKGKCEDSLNIINSNGFIKNISINEAYSDAIDIDFSNIQIEMTQVNTAGNDCIDVSNGEYNISLVKVSNCTDKGLSVGEKSNMKIDNLIVKNSSVGFSNKDLSNLLIKKSTLKDTNICYEINQKKQEFGGGKVIIDLIKCEATKFVDKNSIIIVR